MRDKNILGYNIICWLLRPLFSFFFRSKVVGKKNIPKNGSVIFCGNHLNFKDQFYIVASTKKPIHWMSKKEYFDGPWSWFFRLVGCISVDRKNHGGNSLNEALKYLSLGSSIGIFPEGTRNKTNEELLSFKIGAVYLAQKSGASLVPFAITGDLKVFSKNTVLRIGKPFKIGQNEDLKEANNKLYNCILDLQRKNYDMMHKKIDKIEN